MSYQRLAAVLAFVASTACMTGQSPQHSEKPKPVLRVARLTGGTKPGACVVGHMTPEALGAARQMKGPATVMFSVEPDGKIGSYKMLTDGVPLVVNDGIEAALRACPWEPSIDMQGRPV